MKHKHKHLILDIKGNSLDDGPGIRSVIFFKGCPLSCVWCHNPESKNVKKEISFDSNTCAGCDTCIKLCTEKALSQDNLYFIDRTRCKLCFKCVEACPSGALSIVGREMSIDEVVDKIVQDKPFYDTSGGGVTLSGGEPVLYMEYTSRILQSLKKKKIHTLVETSGYFNIEKFTSMIYPYSDSIYYDIKLYNCDKHQQFCGVDNKKIVDNFTSLYHMSLKNATELLPRIPLIPGITDTDENLTSIADFLCKLGVTAAKLLPYNPLWHEKNRKIGRADNIREIKDPTNFMDKETIDYCKDIFISRGIVV